MPNTPRLWKCPLCAAVNRRPRPKSDDAGAFIICPNCYVEFNVQPPVYSCPAAFGVHTQRRPTHA